MLWKYLLYNTNQIEVFIIQAGVTNKLEGTIKEIKTNQVMAQVDMTLDGLENGPVITSVMTKDSLEDSGFKKGDHVVALIKAINVVFVK